MRILTPTARAAGLRLAMLLASLLLAALPACREAPRDNPFDPESGLLLVSVLAPADSSRLYRDQPVTFRAEARRGFDLAPVEEGLFRWRSDRAGELGEGAELVLDSLPAGFHRVTVTVTDLEGRRGIAELRLTVLATPEFGVRLAVPAADTILLAGQAFAPAAVEYLSPGIEAIGRLWRFGAGSGLDDFQGQSPGEPAWDQPGEFLLVYQLVDGLGRVATDTARVTVLAESEPPVVMIASPAADTTLYRGDSLWLEAVELETTSPVISRRWVYPAGSGLESRDDRRMAAGWRVFAVDGAFELVYLVQDGLGVSVADTVAVTVLPPPAELQAAIASPGADTTVYAGDSLWLAATLNDPGRVDSSLWSWAPAGESSRRPIAVNTASARVAFPGQGRFRVYFTAVDDRRARREDSVAVEVLDRPVNALPAATILAPAADTALVAWSPAVSLEGLDLDLDGAVVERNWSLVNADGQALSLGHGRSLRYRFTAGGSFRLVYAVVDDLGGVGADTLGLTVQANQPPAAEILSPLGMVGALVGEELTFIGMDSDPGGTVVSRRWDYGAGSGLAPDTVSVPGLRGFPAPGTFVVVYSVVDELGVAAADSVTVSVLSAL